MRVFRGRVYFPDCTTYINKKEILQTVDAPLIEELFSLATIFSVISICAYDFLNLLIIHKIQSETSAILIPPGPSPLSSTETIE